MRILTIFEAAYGSRENPNLGDAAWLVESPENRSLATRVWAEAGSGPEVTLFNAPLDEPGDEDALALFEDVDLHHPSWTEIGFVGVRLTEELAQVMLSLGATTAVTDAGFIARR
ncbi:MULTISPECIES: hypothetical protein [unclassified Caulobacter]|jgi:hypothetical protein|uniref:hypothetical protein n=1 Tax=unclassified Caulobacter TaxID=2648921 RepID=UPI0012E022AB|nr:MULTISPECIES: hypothetical protein [unclassified Caulobacter]